MVFFSFELELDGNDKIAHLYKHSTLPQHTFESILGAPPHSSLISNRNPRGLLAVVY
ncbi:hypothetical protein Scep_014724 [Stephania cephalantha]|uniref:Uncharacterized protein n=1 Tax=Stephania cephalantha TaxID=152367 RepID=A0AAP0J1V4_9MAGN